MIRLKLKEVLQQKGVSMGKLSRMSDVSYSTVARICNDKNYSPSIDILHRIAEALEVCVSDLYEVEDSNKKDNTQEGTH